MKIWTAISLCSLAIPVLSGCVSDDYPYGQRPDYSYSRDFYGTPEQRDRARERLAARTKRGVTKLIVETRPLIWQQGITAGSAEIPRRQCFVNTTSEFASYEQFLRRKLHKIEGARHSPPVSRLNVSSTH
jgi:hypothetical protein